MAANLCLYCGGEGHRAMNCPKRPKALAVRAVAATEDKGKVNA